MKRWLSVSVAVALLLSVSAGGYVALGAGGSFEDALTVDLDAPHEVALGEPVAMRVSLKNNSWRPVRIYHGYPQFNLRVETPDGEMVWDWTAGRVFPSALVQTLLSPRGAWEFEYAWEQHHSDCDGPPVGTPCAGSQVPPGEYIVYGYFLGDRVDPSESGNWQHRTEGQALRIAP